MKRSLIWVGALALSCSGTQLMKGYTDCQGTTCNPGTYCDVAFCLAGCASEANCLSNEACVKPEGLPTGSCVSSGGTGGGTTGSGGGGGTSGGSGGGSSGPCTPRPDGLDGCSATSVCLGDPPTCVSFAPCGAGDSCPVGSVGSVCNTGYIPNKNKVCLTTLCNTTAHCPANWFCVRFPSNAVLGECNSGGPGSLCTKDAECLSNDCAVNPGFPGVCF